jgi:N-acetylneuraminic acid mutarotase
MIARNVPGAAEDLHSVADVAMFNPQTKRWATLPPLPEGRSSHAAVVVDGKLYVIGGWELRGAETPRWHTTSLTFDLRAKNAEWKVLVEQPFQRRALAAAADGKLYVFGGLLSAGGISHETNVFDFSSHAWSKGPSVPGTAMNGNGIAACAVGGRVYISGMDGNVYMTAPGSANWEVAGQLKTPRFHHRLLPLRPGVLLAVAGATHAGKLRTVDAIVTSAAAPSR